MKNNFKDWEFKIITGTDQEIQNFLNQWKHNYELNIISMCRENQITILLVRKEY